MANRVTPSRATTFPNDSTPQTENKIIDENNLEIAHRRQRNARLPVARIPPEILSKVLLYHRDASSSRSRVPGIAWISVTHVSYYWRSVALSDPRLWTFLDLRFPRLLDHFSQHYGSVPLHVILSAKRNRPSAEHALQGVCLAKNPINTVRFRGDHHELSQLAPVIFTRSAHELVSLELAPGSFYGQSFEISALEETSFPNLRFLSLEHVNFSLDCAMMHSCTASLQELTLANCSLEGPTIGALSSLPKLERLSVTQCLTIYNRIAGDTTISLPALTALALDERAADCILLLARIQRPSGCSTSVRLAIVSTGHGPPSPPEGIVRHIIATKPCGEVCLRLNGHNLRIECERHTLDIPLRLRSFTWGRLGALVCAILESGPDALRLPWRELGHLKASTLITLCGGALASVRTLKIDGVCAHWDVLAECIYAHEDFLPELAALHVEDADFTRLGASEKMWKDGVEARRAILKEITTVRCKGNLPS